MRNVSQLATSPDFKPVINHCVRCAEVPWVNESGTTRPCAWCCNRSSPMAEAVCIAASTSPGSMNCHLACARFAHRLPRGSLLATPLGPGDRLPQLAPLHVAPVAPSAVIRAGSGRGGRSREQSHRLARTGRSCCRRRKRRSAAQGPERSLCRGRPSGHSDNRTDPLRIAQTHSRTVSLLKT